MGDPLNHQEIIKTYFDCFRSKDLERLRSLLVKDFRHVSPFAEWSDRDSMLDAIWPSVDGEVYATDLEIFGEGPDFLVRYKHAGKSTAHFAEYFRFQGDKIAEIEVYLGIGALPKPDAKSTT